MVIFYVAIIVVLLGSSMIPRDDSPDCQETEQAALQVVHHTGSNSVTTECAPLLPPPAITAADTLPKISSCDIIPVWLFCGKPPKIYNLQEIFQTYLKIYGYLR